MQSGTVKVKRWNSALYVMAVLLGVGSCFTAQAAPAVTITNNTQFKDTSGALLHAHGGGMIKVGTTYYWFGECRQNGGYLFDSVKCYKSTDLKNWTFVRNALSRTSASELNTCNIERPKVMYCPNTGQYVMWMHWENGTDYNAARCAVAYSSTVEGPYTYQGSFRPYQNQGVTDHGKPGYMSRDCTVFVEGNSGYFISASNDNRDLHLYRLTSDFRNIATLDVKLFVGSSREAPCLFKRGSYYFLLTSGCTGWYPNQAQYAYSASLTSGWSKLMNIGDSTTYNSQSAFVIPVAGSTTTSYLYLGDRWGDSFGARPNDSRYIWLPLNFGSNTSMSMLYYPYLTIDTDTGAVAGSSTINPTATPTPTPTITVKPTATPTPTPTITLKPTVTPNPTQTAAGCAVNYSQSDWGGGASVSITIKNNGATAINGWTLAWNFAGNQTITNMWNATYTQSGTAATVKNASYNGAIPAQGSVSFGFNLSYSGTNAKPTSFTLNGAACQIE